MAQVWKKVGSISQTSGVTGYPCKLVVGESNGLPLCFSPALWLDASDASTITTESDKVSQWADKSGIVINDREAEEISGADLGETVTVKLYGDDLEVPSGSQAIRLLTVQGTYMDKDGEIMPFSDGIYVQIDNLAGIQIIV